MLRSTGFLKPMAAITVMAVLLTSCAGVDSPTGPSAASTVAVTDSIANAHRVPPLLPGGILAACPQGYSRTAQLVGPAGGTVTVGRHSLVIPRGALASPVLITAETPADTVISVRFGPKGLRFAKHARLSLDYSRCSPEQFKRVKHIAYTTDDLRILDLLLSDVRVLLKVKFKHGKLTANLDHFSRYAVAW